MKLLTFFSLIPLTTIGVIGVPNPLAAAAAPEVCPPLARGARNSLTRRHFSYVPKTSNLSAVNDASAAGTRKSNYPCAKPDHYCQCQYDLGRSIACTSHGCRERPVTGMDCAQCHRWVATCEHKKLWRCKDVLCGIGGLPQCLDKKYSCKDTAGHLWC
jgi:hypothetical protein